MTAFTKLSIRLVGILTFSAVSLANADDLTFYADALPVFQKNCVACHQDNGPDVGGIFAPMALDDYEQAKIWAPLIKNALVTNYMPPWGAHERHRGEFKGERYIDKKEKDLLIAWVDGGALEGNPSDAANNAATVANGAGTTLPDSGWWIGDPDLVVQFEEDVYVPDEVMDWQPLSRCRYPRVLMKILNGFPWQSLTLGGLGCITLYLVIWESVYRDVDPLPTLKVGEFCCQRIHLSR